MSDPDCPNTTTCKLVNNIDFLEDKALRDRYIKSYCKGGKSNFESCTRYTTKNTIHFCPDFVLPDTDMTLNEIIDKYEQLEK
jgi:hypothetical protein